MYAIKKNINKVLAAFLCACLLLSYNPAIGTTGTAWADDPATGIGGDAPTLNQDASNRDGLRTPIDVSDVTDVEMTPNADGDYVAAGESGTTIINAGTYNSTLRTDQSKNVYGTVDQIKGATEKPVVLRVEATYADGLNEDAYTFVWQILENGEPMSDAVQALLQRTDVVSVPSPNFDNTRKIAYSNLNLTTLFSKYNNDYFKDDAAYTFSCKVTADKLPATADREKTCDIMVYTVDSETHKSLYPEDELRDEKNKPVVSVKTTDPDTGGFTKDAELVTGVNPGEEEDNLKEAFSREAKEEIQQEKPFDEEGATITPGKPIHVVITGGPVVDGEQQKPYSGPYYIAIPIDTDYVYDADNNRNGFQEGDTIPVMWKDKASGSSHPDYTQHFKAKIEHEDPDDPTTPLVARFLYDPDEYSCTGADSVDDKVVALGTWTKENLPGFFALGYPSSNLPPDENNKKGWYYIEASVQDNVGGTVSIEGRQPWPTESDYSFNIYPEDTSPFGGERYYLSKLLFSSSDGIYTNRNVLENGSPLAGIKVDPTRSRVTITKPLSDWTKYETTYSFVAVFTKVNTDNPLSVTTLKLGLQVVDEEGNYSNKGIIDATYQVRNPENGVPMEETASTASKNPNNDIKVAYSSQVKLNFIPHAPENDINYGIIKVQTSRTGEDGTWVDASFNYGELNVPFMDDHLYVRLTVGDVDAEPPEVFYQNVTVKAVDESGNKLGADAVTVDPTTGVVAYNSVSHSTMSINMNGGKDYFPKSVLVQVGSGVAVETDYLGNKETPVNIYKYDPTKFALGFPNADVTITVVFAPTGGTYHDLAIVQSGKGTVNPLSSTQIVDGKIPVIGGSNIPTLIVEPELGYKVGSAQMIREDGTRQDVSDLIMGGQLSGVQMPEGPATLAVTFVKDSTIDDLIEPDSETGLQKTRDINVYVASAGMETSNQSLKYIWDSASGNKVPVNSVRPASSTDADRSISTTELNLLQGAGEVNGTNGFTANDVTLASNYWLDFKGKPVSPGSSIKYTVNKVLVVNYSIESDTAKQVTGMTLYNYEAGTSTFMVGPTSSSVDVIVFFGGTTEAEPLYKTVTMQQSEPSDGLDVGWDSGVGVGIPIWVPVGGYLTLSDLQPTDGYKWKDLLVNGVSVASSSAVTKNGNVWAVEIGPVMENTTWQAVFQEDNGGGGEEPPGPNPPVGPGEDEDDAWNVRAHIVSAGSGGSLSMTHGDETTANEISVPKAATNKTVEVNFPASTGYTIKSVKVKRTTGNAFGDVWDWITGGNAIAGLETTGAATGKLVINPIEHNYEIWVEYAPSDPDDSSILGDLIPVNVYSDAAKGVVKPYENVRVKKDGEPQFSVYTTQDKTDNKWYEIEKVQLTSYHTVSGSSGTISASTTATILPGETGKGIKWDADTNYRFTLDMAALDSAVGTNSDLTAVDLEVIYKKGDSTSQPWPDEEGQAKALTIIVKGNGKVSPGTGGDPEDPLYLYPYRVKDNSWARFLMTVVPTSGYELTNLTVTTDGVVNSALAMEYLQSIMANGYFYVDANETVENSLGVAEVIEVTFEQLSENDGTYTVQATMGKGTSFGNADHFGAVVPTGAIRVPNEQSFSFTFNPWSADVRGVVLEDYYLVGDTKIEVTDPDYRASIHNKYVVTVKPYKVNNKTVDRYITLGVDFEGTNELMKDNQKGNIKVTIYGNTNKVLEAWPGRNQTNIYVGAGAYHTYNFRIPQSAVDQYGYYIYAMKLNDTWVLGGPTGKPDADNLRDSITARFTGDSADASKGEVKLKTGDNTIKLYMGKYPGKVIPDGTGDGNLGNIGGTGGNGGFVGSGTNSAGISSSRTVGASAVLSTNTALLSGEEGTSTDDASGSTTKKPDNDVSDADDEEHQFGEGDDPYATGENIVKWKIWTVVPKPGHVVDDVYLDNLQPLINNDSLPEDVRDRLQALMPEVEEGELFYEWITPFEVSTWAGKLGDIVRLYENDFGDTFEKQIVLRYGVKLDNLKEDGNLHATFLEKPLDEIDDMTNPPDHFALGHDNLLVEFTPAALAQNVAYLFSPDWEPTETESLITDALYNGLEEQTPTVASFSKVEESKGGYTVVYSTKPFEDHPTFEFTVGPLVKPNSQGKIDSTCAVYTIDEAALKAQGLTVEANKGDYAEVASTEDKNTENYPEYWRYYTIKGSSSNTKLLTSDGKVKLTIPLVDLQVNNKLEESAIPEFDWWGEKKDLPKHTVTATAGAGGSITPVSSALAGNWASSENQVANNQWLVPESSYVSFDVRPANGFTIFSLSRISNGSSFDCLANGGGFSGTQEEGGVLTFPIQASDVEVRAIFRDTNSMRTITISVVGDESFGTVSPIGERSWPKGESLDITLIPAGVNYVPVKAWINNAEQPLRASQTSLTVPADTVDQKVEVQFAPRGSSDTNILPVTYLPEGITQAVGLAATGNNPIIIACVLGVGALAVIGVWYTRRRKAAEARAAKYSVTKRK